MEFHKRGPTPQKRKLTADDKVAHKRRYDACERKREFQPHWLKQFSWLKYKSSSAGAGVAAHAGGAADQRDNDTDRLDNDADRRDDDADQRDDDAVVDVEGGESDGTAKNTDGEEHFVWMCTLDDMKGVQAVCSVYPSHCSGTKG